MTEIIKNSKSISLDFIDTGTPGGKSPEGHPVFDSVYSNLDLNSGRTYKKEQNIEETEIDKNVSEIIGNLDNLATKIEPSTVQEIKELLLSFIGDLNRIDPTEEEKGSKDNFAKLMNLLQKLEDLLTNQNLNVSIQDDDKKIFLDQIRVYLNKKITAKERTTIEKVTTEKNQSRELSSALTQKKETSNQGVSLNLEDINKKNSPNSKESTGHFEEKKDKNWINLSKDIASSFTKSIKQKGKEELKEDGVYRPNKFIEKDPQGLDLNKKKIITKVEMPKDAIIKIATNVKDTLNSEVSSKIHDVNLQKTEQNNSSSNQNNNQSNFNFKSEHNSKLIDTLNMLSKNWGNKLIEKIEKSIINGDESLEISLSPKSLGKLNITINMQDSLTRINIVSESASAAALLGESESKLSQMMEASGLKLSTLLTSSHQFGKNNGKNLKHRSILKTNSEKEEKVDSSNILSPIQQQKSTKEGLNLIA